MISILCFSLIIFIVVFFYWQIISSQKKSLFLLICSFIFVAFFTKVYAIYFLFMIIAVYFVGKTISQNEEKKKIILLITLFFLISNLILHKYLFGNDQKLFFSQLNNSTKVFWPFGLSYISFRLIHYTVEVYRERVPICSLTDFALYVLFFPTFLAGPVERFPTFQSQRVEKKQFDILNINYGLYRIICGLIRKIIIADNLKSIIIPVLLSPQLYIRTIVILAIYGLAIQIYMDFSGYTDIAIGISKLFGYKVMENFNKPFLQKNIALFWRSWHISIYSWIRDYFFFPLFGSSASIAKLYLGIFLSMVVFHLWHAASVSFLLLGMYHGTGLIIWKLFQKVQKITLIRKLVSYKWLTPVSVFFTFSFVGFSFIFFNFEIHNALNIIKRIFT